MLTIKDLDVVEEKTSFPLLGDKPENCVVVTNVPQAGYGESKVMYIKKFFRSVVGGSVLLPNSVW